MGAVPVDQRAPVGPLVAGAKLGRYEILAKLAAGGMAIVYVGRVLGVAGFERLVAIKVLHANLAHEEEFIGMFLDEARLAASIRHPNVVPTIDISDSVDAGYFIVMEYIEGDHLGALLSSAHKSEEKIPIPITLRIVADALGGLGAAHDLCDDTGKSLNLVHRDVSPHNIIVGRDGVVRLTDFGVAKAEDRLTHTRDGQVKGKLAYMAPEQAASGQTDSRSDLFSMGVILWECVTGRRLFRADNTAATLHKLLHHEIPAPSSVDPALAPLDGLLGKALSRDLDARFQTAEEFAQAIEEVAPALGGLASLRGVGRCVKHHTAAKLKREKKLIDDALRALRPADAIEIDLENESEVTSPSATEISVTGASLSASKISGVFSHDTIPGTRRQRAQEAGAALARALPTSSHAQMQMHLNEGTGTGDTSQSSRGSTAGNRQRTGGAVVPTFDVAGRAQPTQHLQTPFARRATPLLWITLAALALGLAYGALKPTAAPAPVAPLGPIVPALANTSAPAPESSVHVSNLRPAPPAPDVQAEVRSTPPTAAEPVVGVAASPLTETVETPRAERVARPVASKRDDPGSSRSLRRPRKEHVDVPRPAASVREERQDLMPNPYHD
jgi:serine/threonine protein kinase